MACKKQVIFIFSLSSVENASISEAFLVSGERHMSNLEEKYNKLAMRLAAVEAHLVKLVAGTTRFVPGGAVEQPEPELPAEKLTLWETVTAELTHKQVDALKAAGLYTVKSLREAAAEEDGFIRIDGLGKAADATLRKALEGLK